MHLEFLSDRKTFILILVALSALAMLATGFVYPRSTGRRLSVLRFFILVLFFIGAVSLTLVYPVSNSRTPVLYILMDRSASMEQAQSSDGKTRAKMAEEIGALLEEAAESSGITARTVFFAEEASDRTNGVGDRRTTRFSPALSFMLEKTAAEASGAAPARAILISDGAAADEPMIDPYLTALSARGISMDVWPFGTVSNGSEPKLFFKLPPPATATVGESVPLDIGMVSQSQTRLTVADGSGSVSEHLLKINSEMPELTFLPRMAGLRKVTVTAQNEIGSSKLNFRIKVLPRLLFELTGRPSWDARYFLVACASRPGVSVRGRWAGKSSTNLDAAKISIVFGESPPSVPPDEPVLYWPQSEMNGSDRGIRWLGREAGSFSPAAEDMTSGRGSIPPISARQKVSLDLGWKVIARYSDGGIFLAERVDSTASPAFLVNGEGMWRWWVNPILANSVSRTDARVNMTVSVEYERFLDNLISWARRMTFPPAELFALQEIGQIGAPMEFVALFSTPPSAVPVLKIHSPDGSPEDIYGTGSTHVRYTFLPKRAGTYRAELSGVSKQPVETSFEVSDAPFDIAHPEPRPDLMRRIAARTGGRVLSQDRDGQASLSLNESVARTLLTHVETVNMAADRVVERRIRLAQTPLFFLVLTSLFVVLWTLESKWMR